MKFDVRALDTTHGHQDFVPGPAENCKIPLIKENSLLSAEISSFVNNKALGKNQKVIAKADNQPHVKKNSVPAWEAQLVAVSPLTREGCWWV